MGEGGGADQGEAEGGGRRGMAVSAGGGRQPGEEEEPHGGGRRKRTEIGLRCLPRTAKGQTGSRKDPVSKPSTESKIGRIFGSVKATFPRPVEGGKPSAAAAGAGRPSIGRPQSSAFSHRALHRRHARAAAAEATAWFVEILSSKRIGRKNSRAVSEAIRREPSGGSPRGSETQAPVFRSPGPAGELRRHPPV